MPCWKLESEKRLVIGLIATIWLVMGAVAGTAQAAPAGAWQWQPWISVAGGHESDLVLDPGLTRTLVPGGYFQEIAPGFRLSRRLSRAVNFRVLNRTTWERFANEVNRTLFGSQLFGEFQFRDDSILRGRIAFSGDYFNDSGASNFRRYSGGCEAGAGIETSRWILELSGFMQGRAYPNVGVLTNAGTTTDYTETHRGLSGSATWHPVRSFFLRGQVSGRKTDALDPSFESTSLTGTVGAELRLSPRAWCSASLTSQNRNFTNRVTGADEDSYYQYGLGAGYNLSQRVSLTGRYSFADYTYPDGAQESTERFSLSATWQFGRKATLMERGGAPARSGAWPAALQQSPVLVRVHAPDALLVTVAGSFNQWHPTSHQMQKKSSGWWELKLELPPRVYEYVYLVDGETVTPTDADRLADDGFGGQNGILEIGPSNR